ncbi:response regulator transcription factor [Geomonas sp. RF6]|uniref:response regulator transcription factor n=1 Tax=Geomonas sp. RF6 TaxID=2897342 RepID=UPI001E4E57A3|nr:response regulator transcription factor [Geomonas sp. RF6]UFS69504.1 response regulator transcription factor [Geomonas sp. RF6]
MAISLVLADDHPIFLDGLATVLQRNNEFQVLATCSNGEEAIEAVRLHHPDIAVLDIKMPRTSGLEAARQIRREQLNSRIVLLTAELEEEETLEALRIGVQGLLLKNMALHLIMQCMRKVYAGESWVEHHSAVQALEKMLRRESGTLEFGSLLTPREMEIMRMVTRGLRNREIANHLCLSEGTVKVHLHNIYEKVKVDGRVALIRHAHDRGFV